MTLLLGLVILCLGWLVPNHYHPWVSFQQEWVTAVGASLIGCAALAPMRQRRIQWPALARVTLAVTAVPLLQFWAGQVEFVSDAVLAALYIAAFALAMVAGATLVQTRRQEFIGGLFGAFLVAGIVSTGLAAVQWLQLGPIGYIGDLGPGSRPYANLAQPNHLATLLTLALVGVLWLFETRRIGAAASSLATAWLGLGLVMTQSRTGWLIILALAGSIFLMRRRTSLRTTLATVGIGVALFIASLVLWQPISEALLVASESFGQRLQSSPRFLLWRAFIDALSASPWVGYGWTQVGRAAQAASLEHITQQGLFINSHNLLLDLLLWNGVPLGLTLTGALVWWFARQLRRCLDVERWLLLAAVGAVFVHAMFEYPLEYAYFLLPVGFVMGALDGINSEPSGWRTSKWIFAVPLGFLMGMLGWIGVEYMTVEESARQMRLVMAGIGVDKVPSVPAPDVHVLDAPREFHRYWLTRARVGMTATELEWMRKVVARYPVPPAQLRYALAAGLNGRPTESIETLTRLCFMHPPERCQEAQAAWLQSQKQYPQLKAIAFPDPAARLVSRMH